ncbi:hypothetical protein M569_13031 [Genlisea aurea]|uniref:Uncharacterized protein n=1 Tax=Genlisea aurea TaxID=192259 RepID=S8DG29_9LAMI|nr:hypothetical protein M569_13031 [Genlisea aurea]
MTQVLTTASPSGRIPGRHRHRRRYTGEKPAVEHLIRTSFHRSANSGGRISCFFSENRKKEQAQKALESALGEKKPEFEKWSKEIKRREEAGGGGGNSGGGWFRRQFGGGSDGDHFRQEAQQVSLTILGLIAAYAVLAKGDVLLAVIFNPLLVVLRSIRSSFTLLTPRIVAGNFAGKPEEGEGAVSAKDRVVGKWRNG